MSDATVVPRPEHSEPIFRRESWLNLNGPWAFDFDPDEVGEAQECFTPGAHDYGQTIVVPYPWQSHLSGIAVEGNQILLNGEPLYLMTALDQGYWPDGMYTARPTRTSVGT